MLQSVQKNMNLFVFYTDYYHLCICKVMIISYDAI